MRRASARKAMAGWLVHAYPQPWRTRYEDEVLALVDEAPMRWGDLADLARGLVVERVWALFEPGDRPFATWVAVRLAWSIMGGAVILGSLILGSIARTNLGPIPWWWAIVPYAAVATSQIRYYVREMRRTAKHGATHLQSRHLTFRIGVTLIGLLALLEWAGLGFPLWWGLIYPFMFPAGSWSRMGMVMVRLRQYRHDIKWALLELERCEMLRAAGQSSPLEEAKSNIERIRKSREDALNELHAMGYRARFRDN